MKKLVRYNLDYDLVLPYVLERLDKANLLSITIQELIPLKTGVFFTLLPEEANLSQIDRFDKGILPKGKITKVCHLEKSYSFEMINTVRNELAQHIYDIIKKNQSLSFISDDVKRYATDINDHELFISNGVCFDRDVYYLINGTNASRNIILKSLQESNAFWHSLSIVTTAKLGSIIDRKMTKEMIQECCLCATLIIIGAYDGEGYVFWEKPPSK